MSLTAHEQKLLNEMNSTALEVKLGDELKEAQTTGATNATAIAARGILFKKALVSGEIASSVATVATGVSWTKFAGVMVTAADGTVRAVTNVSAVSGTGNGQKIAVTATGVIATDVLSLLLA